MTKQKVIFFGTGKKSKKCLKYLYENFKEIKIICLCPNFYEKTDKLNETIQYAKNKNIKILNLN